MHNSLHMADDKELTPEEQAEKDFGHPEGTEYESEHGTEVVIYDRDEDGNIIGWHKALKDG